MKLILLKSIGTLIIVVGILFYFQFYMNEYVHFQKIEAQENKTQQLTTAQEEILFYVGTDNLDQATIKLKKLIDTENTNIEARFKLAQLYFEMCKSDYENCPDCEWQLQIILKQDSTYYLAKDLLKQVELLIGTKK